MSSWATPRLFQGNSAVPKAAKGLQRPSLRLSDFKWLSMTQSLPVMQRNSPHSSTNFAAILFPSSAANGVCSSSVVHSLTYKQNKEESMTYRPYSCCMHRSSVKPLHSLMSSCGECSQSHPPPTWQRTPNQVMSFCELSSHTTLFRLFILLTPLLSPSNPYATTSQSVP